MESGAHELGLALGEECDIPTTSYVPPQTKTRVKHFFSQRVVSDWNQLPNHVKMVQKTNEFKNAYDRHTGFGRNYAINQ